MNLEALIHLVEKKINQTEDHLNDFRKTQLALLNQKGFEEIELDSYQFTNMNSFYESLHFSEEMKNEDVDMTVFQNGIPTIMFIDGEFSHADPLPEGLHLKKLDDSLTMVEKLKQTNALSHLHHAIVREGLVLEIAKNTVIQSPVRILNIQTRSGISGPTYFIEAHPHSKITLIEETTAVGDVSHGVVSETYIKAHPHSNVEHITLEFENNAGIYHSSVFADVDQDASFKGLIFSACGKMNRTNLVLNLNAPGANGESYSLYLTHKNEHSDIYTEIIHHAPDTTSSQLAKGILSDESHAIFKGKIHINPKAQRVYSRQLNKNLLLSNKAQVHSCPQLEIFADDVKCSHGSTTGQLSLEEVFYFQARGIPEQKAKNLLSLGFCLEIVDKINNTSAHKYVNDIIRNKLKEKFSLGKDL